MKSENKIPSPVEFILKAPLYHTISWENEDVWHIIEILYFRGNYDIFCPECGKEATFSVSSAERPTGFFRNEKREKDLKRIGKTNSLPELESRVYTLQANCTRTYWHTQRFHVLVCFTEPRIGDYQNKSKGTIQKIGQHPSIADLQIQDIKQYHKILGKELSQELTKAIGLSSHGIGVGSYVYLRRVFENLIERAHQEAIVKVEKWDEGEYIQSRMSEKIKILKNLLPQFLVETPALYSVLSKGIHELTEDECNQYFSTIKLCIELILDDWLEKIEREKKIAEAKKALENTAGKLIN